MKKRGTFNDGSYGKPWRSPLARLLLVGALIAALILVFMKREEERQAREEIDLFAHGKAVDPWLSKTFSIEPDPDDPNQVWFGTAQGLRRHRILEQDWKVFHRQDGLATGEVAALEFDPNALWLGTWKGLYRFDRNSGQAQSVIAHPDYLPPRIFQLKWEGSNLWAATYGDGVVIYSWKDVPTGPIESGSSTGSASGSAKRQAELAPDTVLYVTEADGLSSNKVYSLEKVLGVWYLGHEDGTISYGSLETGWRKLEFPEAKSSHSRNEIWDLMVRGSQLWVATAGAGVWAYDFAQKTWTQHVGENGFHARGAYALTQDSASVYAGSAMGLFRFHIPSETWIHMPEPRQDEPRMQITAIAVDPWAQGSGASLWYAAANRGVGKVGTEKLAWYEYPGGLRFESVECLLPIGEWLWVGYGFQGGYLHLMRNDFLHSRDYNLWVGQELEHVNKLKDLGGLVFLGGFVGYAHYARQDSSPKWRVRRKAGKEQLTDVNDALFIPIERMGSHSSTDSAEKLSGELLVAGGSGIFRETFPQGGVERLEEFPPRYYSVLARHGTLLLAGTLAHGLELWSREPGGAFRRDTTLWPGTDLISSALRVDSATLWFGTRRQGIFQVAFKNGGELDSARTSAMEIGDWGNQAYVKGMALEGDRIWVASQMKGAAVFSLRRRNWLHLSDEDLLEAETVSAVAVSDDHVWLADGAGITRLLRDSVPSLFTMAGKN